MEMFLRDSELKPIWEKLQQGERLTLEDGRVLFKTTDILSLGKMANFARRNRSGDAVYYALNQKIEPTNVCVLSCKFCDFATKQGSDKAYEMTIQEILSKLSPELHEVHITGGLHPDWQWEYYLDMLRQIKKNFPEIDIKAFTAVEIDFFHKKFKLSLEEVLRQLKDAGLRTMPGGGAAPGLPYGGPSSLRGGGLRPRRGPRSIASAPARTRHTPLTDGKRSRHGHVFRHRRHSRRRR